MSDEIELILLSVVILRTLSKDKHTARQTQRSISGELCKTVTADARYGRERREWPCGGGAAETI